MRICHRENNTQEHGDDDKDDTDDDAGDGKLLGFAAIAAGRLEVQHFVGAFGLRARTRNE